MANVFTVTLGTFDPIEGTATCLAAVDPDIYGSYEAIPASGWYFKKWESNDPNLDGGNSKTVSFPVVMDTVTTPVFTQTPPSIITTKIIGNGSVQGPWGDQFIGDTIRFIAFPSVGYTFKEWSWGMSTNSSTPLFETVTGDMEYTATFVKNPVVTIETYPVGSGSATGSGTYNYGNAINLTATPATGFSFVGWKENGIIKTSSINYTAYATADVTFTATFVSNVPVKTPPVVVPPTVPLTPVELQQTNISQFQIRARLKLADFAVEINEKSRFGGDTDEIVREATVLRWFIVSLNSTFNNWSEDELQRRIDHMTDYYDLMEKPLYSVDWLDKFKPITPLLMSGLGVSQDWQSPNLWRVDSSTSSILKIGGYEQFRKTAGIGQSYILTKLVEGKLVRLIVKGGSLSANPFPSYCKVIQGHLSLYDPSTENIFDIYVDRALPGNERVYISFVSGVGLTKQWKSLIYAGLIM